MPNPFSRPKASPSTPSHSTGSIRSKSTGSSSSSSPSPLSTSPGQSAPLKPAMSHHLSDTSSYRDMDKVIGTRSAKTSLMNVLSSRSHHQQQQQQQQQQQGGGFDDGSDKQDTSSSGTLSPGSFFASSSSSIASSNNNNNNIHTPNEIEPFNFTLSADPRQAYSRFNSIDIPPTDLSGDLSAILERPLYFGPNGRVLTGQLHLYQSKAMGEMTGSSHLGVVGSTGSQSVGKSGARHSEFGNDTNQNWRHTSQVSLRREFHGKPSA